MTFLYGGFMKINIIENNEQICYAILEENIVKEFYVIPNKRYKK